MNTISKRNAEQARPETACAAQDVQVGWLQSMGSSVAAAFGVQSYKNRERDFQHGDIRKFVVSGVMLTLTILLSLVGLVQWVLFAAA
jgi:hypothetical protein